VIFNRTLSKSHGINSLTVKPYRLDIHYMLLKDMSRPQVELSVVASQAKATINAYLDFSKDMHIVNWPKSNDKVLEHSIWEWDQWILSDHLDPPRSKVFSRLREPKRGKFVLLRTHPVLCGLMLFRIKLILQESGLTLANAWGALPTVLHLYNACLAQRLLVKPW